MQSSLAVKCAAGQGREMGSQVDERRLGNGLSGSHDLESRVEMCECVLDIASALFNVSGRELRSPGRSPLAISRVRQIAMYVCHVVLELSMTDIGAGFGRDRTTVMHACHVVEDLRDDQEFDAIVSSFERVAGAAFRYHLGVA